MATSGYAPWWHSVSCLCAQCITADELATMNWEFCGNHWSYDTDGLFQRPEDDTESSLAEWIRSLPDDELSPRRLGPENQPTDISGTTPHSGESAGSQSGS